MKQLCIRFDEKTFEKIRAQANEQALKLSEYVRRLVDVGLRVEQISKNKASNNKEPFADLGDCKILWEKELTWTLEMRFLLRILVDQMLSGRGSADKDLLQESKKYAESFVSGLLNKPIGEG